ncbi:MAG: hypothetical protein AABZ32_12455 [Bacteroidota bacterium]
MNCKKSILITTLAFFGWSIITNAQSPVLEKSYEISNKAKRGFLESIEINKDNGNIDMAYILPNVYSTKRDNFLGIVPIGLLSGAKIKYEVYSYDKDLNILGTSREEERAYLQRYKEYSYTTIEPTIRLNCLCLSFKQVEIKAEYNWFSGYKKTSKVVDRKKAENEDGGNYSYTGMYYDLFSEKSILVLAGKKVKKEPWSAFTKYDILNVDNELNIKVAESFDFEFGNSVIYSGPLKDEKEETNDELARDWIIVFAPMSGTKAKTTDLTYVRISPKGKILEKFKFDSPSNAWNIEGAYDNNGSVYLYGSAITKDPAKKYYSDIVNKGWDKLVYTHYQIAKITKGKLDFISSASLKDLNEKQVKPANQKKLLEIDGEEYVTNGIKILNTGEILITYHDVESATEAQGSPYKKQKSVFLFHFDDSGNFKKNFGVEINPDQKKAGFSAGNVWAIPATHYFYPSGDGKKLYWLIRSVKEVDCIGEANAHQNTIECKPMNGIDYGSINLETGEISEYKTIGEDKKPFYLFSKTSGYQMGNYIYFFSETEKGDKMLLTRIDISK